MNSCGTQTTIDCKCDSALFLMHRDTPGVTARMDDTLLNSILLQSVKIAREFRSWKIFIERGRDITSRTAEIFFLASLVKAKYIFHSADVKNCYFRVLSRPP